VVYLQLWKIVMVPIQITRKFFFGGGEGFSTRLVCQVLTLFLYTFNCIAWLNKTISLPWILNISSLVLTFHIDRQYKQIILRQVDNFFACEMPSHRLYHHRLLIFIFMTCLFGVSQLTHEFLYRQNVPVLYVN
jgi:hypothetical protein